ncbi:hypothetical protein TorRG33x02_182160 [Trema orientale]|uniref:Uncharacterized protein n=1 Tax=Trema orientale TaxID=63057 RepID=A0A2P5EKF1_TREOI|nr:hypothetical protein TorRG33x02_182160 [Trema orientale]
MTVRSPYMRLVIAQGGGSVLVSILRLKAVGGPRATSSSGLLVIQRQQAETMANLRQLAERDSM